ncbi:MAG: hypothetical protein ACHQHN_15710 [Sphingobacteriales bacterium]
MNFDQTMGKSFDIEFCQHLEYHLSHAFRNAGVGALKYFWCDGVEVPEKWKQASIDFRESKQIITGAWVGPTGQEKCQMIVQLGDSSFEKCIQGGNIIDCLPDDHSLGWVDIDMQTMKINLQLL